MPTWLAALAAAALAKSLAAAGGLFLGDWPNPVRAWIYFLHVLAFAGAGLGLLVLGRGDRRAGLLGLFLMLVATAFADPLGRGLEAGIPSIAPTVRVMRALEVNSFMAYLLWAFVSEFPRRDYGRSMRLVLAGARRVALGLGMLLLLANLARLGGVPGEVPAALVRWFDRTGENSLYWPLLFVVALPPLPWAFWSARRAGRDERRRVRLLLTGIFLGVLPVVGITLAQALLPAFLAYGGTPRGRFVTGLLVYPALLSIPVMTAYAVLVQRALDVRLYVRQAVRYALARQTVALTAGLPFGVVLLIIYSQREQAVSALWTGKTGLLTLASLALGVALIHSRTRILNVLDRRFFREQYDAHRTLSRLVEEVRRFASSTELAAVLAHEIDRALHVRAVHTLLLDPAAGAFAAPTGGVAPLGQDARLARALEEAEHPLDLDASGSRGWAGTLPADERRWLAAAGARLLVPIHASDGSALGLLVLGEKRSELPFSREDRTLLSTISRSVAFALEQRVHHPRSANASVDEDGQADALARECLGCGAVSAAGVRQCDACGDRTLLANVPVVLAGKFRLQRRIGAGGMGVVYRATDLTLGRDVAVKTLPNLSAPAARRLRREARAMAAVSHPNLALIFGAESWRGLPFLIVEFLPGGTLEDRLGAGPLSVEAALALGRVLAPALVHLHEAGITHRDIKPSNIGFTADGTPRLLDFGLARALDGFGDEPAFGFAAPAAPAATADATATAAYLAGTPLYLSPEAIAGERPGVDGDLWALSMVLYESIAGRHPLADTDAGTALRGLARGTLPDLSSLVPEVPVEVAQFFRSALSPHRSHRPASARDLGERLVRLSGLVAAEVPGPTLSSDSRVTTGPS